MRRVSFARVFPQDIQSEIPSHLLRLKVEVEQNRVAATLADCRGELDREMRALSGTCTSERVLKEHRVGFFTEMKSYQNEQSDSDSESSSPLVSRRFSGITNPSLCAKSGSGTWKICAKSCPTMTPRTGRWTPPGGSSRTWRSRSGART